MKIQTKEEMALNPLEELSLKIVFDQDNCDVCEACVDACREGVLAVVNGRITVVNIKYCNRCGACVKSCPYHSISL